MAIKTRRLQWGSQAVDWQERININRIREERAARTRDKMKERGVAAAILAGANQRYATSVITPVWAGGASRGFFSIVFAEYPEDTIVYCIGEAAIQNRRNCPWIRQENMRGAIEIMEGLAPAGVVERAKQTARQLAQDLRERGVDKERIASDRLIPPLEAALISEGIKLEPAAEMMEEARIIKTKDEIECIKMSGAIEDCGWWAIYENLRPGVTECELAAVALAEIWKRQPGGYFMVTVRSGPNGAPQYAGAFPTDRIIQAGDLVFNNFYGAVYLGYTSDYNRTFKCATKLTDKEKDLYKRAREIMYNQIGAVKAGGTTADVAKYIPREEAERHSISCGGHGIGLSQHEAPTINREVIDYPMPVKEGMVFLLGGYAGEDGINGCKIGSVGVVTDKGWEDLYTWPDEEIIVSRHSL